MELLTGKAIWDYSTWVHDKVCDLPALSGDMYDIIQISLIIEWLDSIGVYLMIGRYGYTINIDNVGSWNRKVSGCRFIITKQAIIHANKIYNER